MSFFALGLVGVVFGWGLCSASLVWYRPDPLKYIFDPAWVRFSDTTNALRDAIRRWALDDETSAASKMRFRLVQRWFGAGVFAATASLVVVELLQDFRSSMAASIEDVVTEPRVSTLLVASIIGFGARLYRREILLGMNALWKIALVNGGNAKDDKGGADAEAGDSGESNPAIDYAHSRFPWYVEGGLLLSIVIVAVIWVNPQLLKNLTSFKAGGVEAHFTTATGSATVQSGLIVTVEPARKTISQGWAHFTYPDKDDPRYDTYRDDGKEVRDEDQKDMTDASIFFESYIKPAFVYQTGVDTKRIPARSEVDDHLKQLATELARLVRDGGKYVSIRRSSIDDNLFNLHKHPFIANDDKKISYNFEGNIEPQYLTRTKWDPYVIQAVGDLLLVFYSKKEQEDFLIAASRGEAGTGVCPNGCRTAGQLSLMYDLILTKVRSTRPWPFKETLKQLSETLDGVNAVLDRNEARWARNQVAPQAKVDCICEKTNSLFRRNRFMDLTLGLELFYQRDLQGQRFSPAQLQTWRDWLTETRAVVDTLDDGIAAWPPPFSDDVRKSWVRARSDLRSRPDMLQDAYVGIALSLVLIGSIEGDVSERDCNGARAFLVRADEGLPRLISASHLDADDTETYRGFLEEVKMSVDGRCRQ